MSQPDDITSKAPQIPVLRPDPIIRADALSHVVFQRRNAEEMGRFLADFGMIALEGNGEVRHYRGHGTMPFLVAVIPSNENRFAGFGVHVRSASDLQKLSSATQLPIEPFEAPGGGHRVRITDPAGLPIDVIHGATMLEPLPTRDTLIPVNTPFRKARTNAGVRAPLSPSAIFKLGHVVLERPDFEENANWYMRHLGVIPTDVQVLSDGEPVIAFLRMDRGTAPADHHSLAIGRGLTANMLHVSLETFDIESVGQGHQYLRARGWTHFWGVGRHLLGSQFFDYWKDPVGDEWEHYADGDVMDASYPTNYCSFHRGTLWAWGHDLPDSTRPDIDLKDIDKIHAAGGFGSMDVETVRQMMRALQTPPRPWLR